MQRKMLYAMGVVLAGALTFAAVANGPYYAMPAWAQKLACATTGNCVRFVVLADWNSEAVLDRETGLVWERSPSTSTFNDTRLASRHCVRLTLGNRKGWKLPTIQELASLVDLSASPVLPSGHPFTNLDVSLPYWSSTVSYLIISPMGWWNLRFSDGAFQDTVSAPWQAWCVRGGEGVDVQ